VRIVIAEDTVLLREGLAGLLEDAGHEVVARVGDAEALLAVVSEHEPDLAVVDVRMPPDYEDEGMRAAATIRQSHPGTAVLVLSQHIETRHALELVAAGGGFGYLLKDRVLDVDDFLDAARRVNEGGSALDPEVVATLLSPKQRDVFVARFRRRDPGRHGLCDNVDLARRRRPSRRRQGRRARRSDGGLRDRATALVGLVDVDAGTHGDDGRRRPRGTTDTRVAQVTVVGRSCPRRRILHAAWVLRVLHPPALDDRHGDRALSAPAGRCGSGI